MLSNYKYLMESDMSELPQEPHYLAEIQPQPQYNSMQAAVSPVDSNEIYPLGIPPARDLDYSKGYPTYKDSDVHYVTFELAQMIAGEDIAARYARARLSDSQYTRYREDAVQEALLGFMNSYKDHPPELTNGTIYILFYTILGRKVTNIYRGVTKRQENLTGELPDRIGELDVEDEVMTKLGRTHAALLLGVLGADLSPKKKELLEHYIANPDLSGPEDAEILGQTKGSMRVAKNRLFADMRKRYEQFKEAGLADTDIVTQPILQMGRAIRRRKATQLSTSLVRHRLHEGIHDERRNLQREVELVVPPYLGQWAVGAGDLKAYLDLLQTSANAAIIYPHKDQLGEFEAYIRPQLGQHSDTTTIFTPNTLRSALLDRFSYVIVPPDVEPALLLKLYRHANFVLHLVNSDTEQQGIPRLRAPKYSDAAHAVEWSKADSIRYIREAYFALGRSPTENDLKDLAKKDQGPSIYRSSKDFRSLASLVLEALTPLRG